MPSRYFVVILKGAVFEGRGSGSDLRRQVVYLILFERASCIWRRFAR